MKKFFTLLFLFGAVSLHAETLSNYIRGAIQKSPLLKSYSYNSREKNKLYASARATRFPRIQIVPEIDQINHADFQYLNYSLNLALSLNLSKALSSYADSALYIKKKSDLEQRLNMQRLILQVKSVYFELLIKERERDILKNAIAYLDNHLRSLKNISKYGAKTYRLSMMRVQTEKADRIVKLNTLNNRISVLRLTLASLSGISNTNSVLTVPSVYMNYKTDDNKSNFLSVQIIRMQQKALAAVVKSKKLYWLPEISLKTGYSVDNDPTGSGNHFDINAAFSFPFPDLGFYGNKFEALKNREKKIEFLLRETERETVLKYRSLKLQISRSFQNYRLAVNVGKNISDALKLAKREYKEGMIGEMDLLDVYRKKVSYMISENELFLKYLKDLSVFEYVTGE